MEFLDIGLEIPAITPSTLTTMMLFQMTKVLKCVRVMEDLDIGLLRSSTLPLKVVAFIIVVTMVEVDLGMKRPATLPLAIVEFIILRKMVEVDLGLKRLSTLPLKIVEQELMLRGEVDIGLRPDTFSSHNPIVHDRFLILSVVDVYESGGISVYDGRCVIISQENIQSSSRNYL